MASTVSQRSTRDSTGALAKALSLQHGPITSDVQRAAQGLEAAILQTQSDLQTLVLPHTAEIERQIRNTDKLSEAVAVSQIDLNEVEADFDANQPKNAPQVSHFLNVITTRQTSQDGDLLADFTLKALKSLRTSHDRLKALEDAVWSGRSADATTLRDLESLGEIDGQCVNGDVTQKLFDRSQFLESLVKDQLSTAWSAAFEIRQSPEGSLIRVAEVIALPPPNATRATLTTERSSASNHTYTIAELNEALCQLGILDQLLSQLQAQILRELVVPVVSSRTLVVEGYHSGDRELRFVERASASATDVVSGIRDLIQFMTNALPSSLAVVNSFLSSFSEAVYQQVLKEVIIPSMPRDLSKLPPWLSDVEQCVSWEQEGPADLHKRVLQRFLAEQAGGNWLAGHRAAGFLEARSLVYEGWKSWDFRLEETKTAASPPPMKDDDGNDEGWGFDDDLQPSDPAPVSVDDGSGWDFDDLATVPTNLTPTPLAKPAREAKRLGKKLSSKHASASASQEALIDAEGVQGSPPPQTSEPDSPSAKPVARASATPDPETQASNSSVRVSVATDAALLLISTRLLELQKIENLRLPAGLQDTLRKGLRSQLDDILDFLRATLPVAHLRTFLSAPTKAVQLGNDFRYMASRMLECEPAVTWPMREEASAGYVSAASMTYQTFQVQEQLKVRSIFQGTNRFVDVSEDDVYHQAESAITELLQFVTDAANQLKPLVDDQLYHEMLGALVETISLFMVNSVLAMEDITEVESQRIESLIKRVESLQNLFRNDNLQMSSVATFAPHWLKMCYTTELLRANLAEISHLYENGSLIDFTPAELSKLIRALFADSQKRAAVLEMIHR